MTLLELAMQQMHDDMVALTTAINKNNELLEARKDVIEGADPIPVELVAISEDALAIISQVNNNA